MNTCIFCLGITYAALYIFGFTAFKSPTNFSFSRGEINVRFPGSRGSPCRCRPMTLCADRVHRVQSRSHRCGYNTRDQTNH